MIGLQPGPDVDGEPHRLVDHRLVAGDALDFGQLGRGDEVVFLDRGDAGAVRRSRRRPAICLSSSFENCPPAAARVRRAVAPDRQADQPDDHEKTRRRRRSVSAVRSPWCSSSSVAADVAGCECRSASPVARFGPQFVCFSTPSRCAGPRSLAAGATGAVSGDFSPSSTSKLVSASSASYGLHALFGLDLGDALAATGRPRRGPCRGSDRSSAG